MLLSGALLFSPGCGSGPAATGTDGAAAGSDDGAGGGGEPDQPSDDNGEDNGDSEDNGDGGDDGDPGEVVPEIGPSPGAEAIGRLLGAVASADRIHVSLRLPEVGVEAALFASEVREDVFAGAPILEGLTQTQVAVDNLAPGIELFLGLGVRRAGDSAYVPAGSVLLARTGAPIYVDPAANPAVADGATPATAFADVLSALVTSFAQGGSNVWLRGGDYDVSSLPVFAGTSLVGGFDADFDPVTRSASASPTVLRGASTLAVLAIGEGVDEPILEGLTIDGNNLATVGIDVDKSGVSMRDLVVRRCTGRGIRLRNENASDPLRVTMVATRSVKHGGDGLSANGAYELEVDGCRFADNVQEGLDLDDLVAPLGETVSLVVRGSAFLRNGTQGLDVDLSEPLILGPAGGRFEVTLEGSTFEGNAEEGLLVDFDFELVEGWEAKVLVDGCRATGNGLDGVHIDADAPGPITVHRLVTSANLGDGLGVTSETDPGLAVVSSSVFTGNQGAGVRASLGNRAVVVTHSIVAGNAGGGIVNEVVGSAASSTVAWLQPDPFVAARSVASLNVTDVSALPFVRAPEAFASIASIVGGEVTLDAASGFASDAVFEVSDDGQTRQATAATNTSLALDPAPADSSGGSIAAFAPGSTVDEDWNVVPNTVAAGAGLAAPGAAAVDAGVYGAYAGGLPGVADAVRARLFRVASTTPALSEGLANQGELEIRFTGGTLAGSSVDSTSVRVLDTSGAELSAGLAASAGVLTVSPPAAGWGAPKILVELTSLRAQGGGQLAASTVLLIRVL